MAITDVLPDWRGLSLDSDVRGVRNYSVSWDVYSDDPLELPSTVLSDPRLPRRADPLAEDPQCTARRAVARRVDDTRLKWQVTLHYSNAPKDTEDTEREREPNPLNRRTRFHWKSARFPEVAERDLDGKPVVNSAGEAFDPPHEIDRLGWEIRVEKNVESVPDWLDDYHDAVNDAEIVVDGRTIPKGGAKIVDIDISDVMKEGDHEYRALSLFIVWKKRRPVVSGETEAPEAWRTEKLDQGLHSLVGGVLTRLTDDEGKPLAQPVLLDGAGGQLADPTTPANAVYRSFRFVTSKDFSALPLT